MKKKLVIALLVAAAVVGLLFWAPWVKGGAIEKVKSTADYKYRMENGWMKSYAELGSGWRPFGAWVSDGDGNDWKVMFWGKVGPL